ncbi:MAG: hypothetical protein IKS87_04890 [Lachnospiraceae bacterium]|nr:hypothetical protein [Lachnospiraceae bacterium]
MKGILKENQTLQELIIGIFCYGLLIQVILAVFFPLRIFRAIGLWTGLLCAVAMAVHMAWCLEKIVMLDEKGAGAYVRKTTLLRYLCVCVVLSVIAVTKTGDPVSFVLGALGLKIGAYLQPLTHKIRTGNKESSGEEPKGGE